MGLYNGYSTVGRSGVNFSLSDIELVERDLLNHIFTKKGSRVMMPDFGTSIPDQLFEPLDSYTVDMIESELTIVFNYDPRVTLMSLITEPNYDTNSLTATAVLYYVELDVTNNFTLNLDFSQG